MLLGGGNIEKMWSVQLFLGVLTILIMTISVPSIHGEPFLLQAPSTLMKCRHDILLFHFLAFFLFVLMLGAGGSILFVFGTRERCGLYAAENRVLPEREDTNHEDMLLTLLLNKKLAWRRPEDIDWELARKFEELEQLEKLKDQLSSEKGSEVAYALESLSASQPKKRACFWKYCI